jgi:MFS family permease
MRLKLSESPVFKAMKAAGETAKNPFLESFTYPGNLKRLFVALFGIAAGLTVIWYTAMFSGALFPADDDAVAHRGALIIVGSARYRAVLVPVLFGHLSDRVGRKKPIVIGYALTLVLMFPLFWVIGSAANPAGRSGAREAPVIVSGPIAAMIRSRRNRPTNAVSCSTIFRKRVSPTTTGRRPVTVSIGGQPVADTSPAGLDAALAAGGVQPLAEGAPAPAMCVIVLAILVLMRTFGGMTLRPGGGLLSEMFPPRSATARCRSPIISAPAISAASCRFISQYIVARTGRSLCRAVVHLRGGRDGARRCNFLAAGDHAIEPRRRPSGWINPRR